MSATLKTKPCPKCGAPIDVNATEKTCITCYVRKMGIPVKDKPR